MSNYSNNNYQQSGFQQQGHNQGNGYNQGYEQPPREQHGNRGEASQYYSQRSQSQGYGQQNDGGQGGFGQEPPQYQQYPSAAAHSSNSGRNSMNQGHQNQYEGHGDPEGDRGIMGGLAGGAAGAYGGHVLGGKAGHGKTGTLVGALAGAFAGHKTQDATSDWKDERDEKKKREKEQEEQQNYQNQQQNHGSPPAHRQSDQRTRGNFGGNFTESSRDVRLDAHGDYTLHAACRTPDGSYQSSSMSLNRILANDGGSFRWSGGDSGGANTYTVQQGDTLRAIAARFAHCSFDELARHNNITNPDMIYPGQNLQIPGGGSRGGGNFAASARNMRLADGGQKLEGELENGGQWHLRNGCLEFV
ncbi:CNVH-domain-containing protein [Ophiobolus disseminans]|uniref:CNVH-domain-containing protein n=1 Tax=Ophiobolus disseminans TaxID=1469910 RepID=A0A6A7ADG4_9PLEO|nr:CNVH-domain-containing protein [Ophiobolus disseminans]